MGTGRSYFSVPAPTDHEARRKREALLLRQSRLKYLSERLHSSEWNLAPHGHDANSDQRRENSDHTRLGRRTDNNASWAEEAECFPGNEDTQFDDFVDEERLTTEQDLLLGTLRSTEGSDFKRAGTGIQKGRPCFQIQGRYDRSSSSHDDVDHRAIKVRPEDYDFPFENLVFEGGGMKGLAYCGAVRYLEELGVMKQVRRFAGASAGSMVAALLAVGYDSFDIEEFLSDRIDKVFLDAPCGYCSFLPNLVRTFGWNPGRRIYEWFGEKLKKKTGNADITFHQVYKEFEKELCCVVTNLSQMTTEYCHPKTTPDMPIRVAIRMSMAIPGLFSAVKYGHFGNEDVYVDGGVLCNYPIHCFDGCHLSMKTGESSVLQHQSYQDRGFSRERNKDSGSDNDKTLGMLLYSDAEEDILKTSLEKRMGCLDPAKPEKETKLFQKRQKEAEVKQRAETGLGKVKQAAASFMKVLRDHDLDQNDVISRNELEAAFKDEAEFPRQQAEVLFGKDFTVNQAFDLLDCDSDGQIRYDELVRFIEENGVCLQSRFLGYKRKKIKNLASFLDSLQSCLVYNVKKLYIEERDLDRTVGINTGHIHTTDFNLDDQDKDFVVERGYNSMKVFLRYYVVQQPDKVQRRAVSSLDIPDIHEAPKLPDTHKAATRANNLEASRIPDAREANTTPNNPETSRIPDTREANTIPNTPETSRIPDTREANTIPNTPETSRIPDTREANTIPNTPETSRIPDTHEANTIPNNPETSRIPDTREANTIPNNPETSRIPGFNEVVTMPELPDTHEAVTMPELPDTHEAVTMPELPDTHEAVTIPELPDTHEAKMIPELSGTHEAVTMPELSSTHEAVTIPELSGTHEAVTIPELSDTHEAKMIPELPDTHEAVTMPELSGTHEAKTIPELPDTHEAVTMPELPDTHEAVTIPELPDIHEAKTIPELPDTCEAKTIPELPDIHEAKTIPELPDTHEANTIPELPDTHEAVTIPELPDTHEANTIPRLPDTHEAKTIPELPDTHEAVTIPELPDTHEANTIPDNPEASKISDFPEDSKRPDNIKAPK